ncbi:MAG: HDOD domain-containing protein [Gammaproteobacteria bacterium]|nr:HDOD domain-containing protein [Gammaproteobacteria bacterium]
MSDISIDVLSGLDFAGLPTPPAILIELIDTCNSSDVSFARLSEIIQKDAGISSKVITAANSPAYRQWNEINDINRLLVVLGLQTVKTIAVTGAVQQFFAQVAQPVERCLDEIWYYSLSCAHIVKSLAELTAYHAPDEAYLAGLLHRLGQLALLQSHPEEYAEIFDKKINGQALSTYEKERLNVTSCEVGAYLIDNWKIRSFISDAVLYQHEPIETILDSSHLVKLVNLASHLTTTETIEDSSLLERADLLFGLNQSVLDGIFNKSRSKVKKAAEGLGIRLFQPTDQRDGSMIRKALGERVKGIALLGMQGNQSNSLSDLQDTYRLIQRDIGVLFGLQESCLLVYDKATETLQAVRQSDSNSELLSAITFSIESGNSLAARAFNKNRISASYSQSDPSKISVADRQLSRILGEEGLIYLPLRSRDDKFGLIAAAVSPGKWQQIKQQGDLLKLFTHEASNTLIQQLSRQSTEQARVLEERNVFHLEARKIIHEANNPLGIINNYLHILGMKLGDKHPVREELNIIKEEIERVGKIILRMRDIPGDLEEQGAAVDVNALISDLFKLFGASLFPTHDIQVSLNLDPNIPPLDTNRGHLKQILTNLVKNSVEAMQDGGTLRVTTRDKVHLDRTTYFEIVVQDNGPGIADSIMQHLFMPVTSTKDSTHSGLGLAIVKNLVDELSGSISCTSSPDSGTRFQLFLPRLIHVDSKAEN